MADKQPEQAIPITDKQEIEKVASEIPFLSEGVDKIDSLTRVPLPGRVIEDITLRRPGDPEHQDIKTTLGDRIRRVFGRKKD